MNQTDIEATIKKRIHEFDLISLIRILNHIGYSFDDILFKSNYSFSSQPSLLHDICFEHVPVRQVRLEMNFGINSAQSLLPSYFIKKLDYENIDNDMFLNFIGFFDNRLLREYILFLFPEINPMIFHDWEQTKNRYLRMLELKSCAGMHLLFQLVFPELGLAVEKATLDRVIETSYPKLGVSVIGGDAVFGKDVHIPVQGLRITFISEEDLSYSGTPWPKEIRKRLEDIIFPLLKKVGIDIEILLVIQTQKGWAKLHSESYLGYDRMKGGEAHFRRIRIYKGRLAES